MHQSRLLCQRLSKTSLRILNNRASTQAYEPFAYCVKRELCIARPEISHHSLGKLSSCRLFGTYRIWFPSIISESKNFSHCRSLSSEATNLKDEISTIAEKGGPVRSRNNDGTNDTIGNNVESKISSDSAPVPDDNEFEFTRSEKAAQAAQLNLSARLPKDAGASSKNIWAGFKEIWRLIQFARKEAKTMGFAFVFILVGSSISISVPYSIGKILDIATKADDGVQEVFGLNVTTFYICLGGLMMVGAAAAFGRIITLRIVGERIVARLRSQLFRRTYTQNAEFFDANRVGDLISRLSSDTLIVGKTLTYNFSEGLRSIVSGTAGVGAMIYVSPQLTLLMAIIGPPVALGGLYYGRIVRNLARKIQESLGALTKIAEERLGNVKTSQSFAGEILEVGRYNNQIKRIFRLGIRDSFYGAAYVGSVSFISFQPSILR